MTAPDTNVEKQTRRHKPALIGIAVAAATVVIWFIVANLIGTEDDAADGAETGAAVEATK